MKRMCKLISFLVAIAMLTALVIPTAIVQANATGIFIRINQTGYKSTASKVAMVMSSTNLSGIRYDVFNSSNTSVLNGTISSSNKGSWGDVGGANCAYTYALDFSALSTPGLGYYIKINSYSSPAFPVGDSVYSSLADLSMQFFKVQRCGNTNPKDHGPCHVLGTGSSIDGKPDGATASIDVSGGWHDASDYIKFMSTIGHVTDVILTTYIHHPEVFPSPASTGGVLTEAKVGLDFIRKMWDNTNQVLYMEVADGLDHDVENDDLDSRSKCWPENDNTIYGTYRPVHPCPPGTGANIAGKAAAALALGAKIWGDPSGPCYNASLASNYLAAAQQIYTWGKTRTGIAGDADGFYVDTDYRDDMAWAAAELYRVTGTSSYLADARSYCDSAGEWYNKSDTSLNWSRAYAWANYEVASLDPTYKSTVIARMNNHLNLKKSYADSQFWNNSTQPKWGSFEAMSNNAVEAMMYQELSGNTTYANLAQQQLDFMLGKNPWGVSMLNGAGSTWFQNPRHRVTTLNRVTNPGYQLIGAWSEGFETSAQYLVDQLDPLLAGQENPNIVQFNDNRMVWHDNRRDYATNEVTISGNVAGMAMTAFMGGQYLQSIPPVPSALSAAAISSSQINVTWSGAAGASGYDLEVDGITISNATSPYSHTGLTAGSSHSYKVRSKNSAGTSSWSSAVNATTSTTDAIVYAPAADAYVRGGTYATQNFGTSAVIDIKDDSPGDYQRIGYIKFTAAGLTNVTNARLRLFGSAASTATVKIYALSDDSWTETGVNYNNKPVFSTLQDTKTISSTAQYYEFDVTNFIQEEVTAGYSTFSFAISGANLQDISISFNSKENGSNAPQLVITGSGGVTVPAAPSGLSASAVSSSQINVTWSGVTGATAYDIEVDGTTISNVNSPYAHTGLTAGSTHSYKVRAKNSSGMSVWSSAVSGTTFSEALDYIANADSYVRDGTYSTTNYGTETTLVVKGDPDAGYSRKGFIKFDLTGRSGTSVASAVLKIYCSSASASTPVVIYGLVGSDSWLESGSGSITWDNQPSSTGATAIGTLTISAAGWYTLDVTSYINSQMSGDKKVTFKLQVENNNGASINFNSRESTSNKPKLTMN